MRRSAVGALIGAAALCGFGLSAARAQPVAAIGSVTAEQHFAAFKAICHDHAGNGKAQAAAAMASPYRMLESEPGKDGTRGFEGGEFSASVLDNGDQRYCMVSVVVSDNAGLAPGLAAAGPILNRIAVGREEDSQTYAWSVTAAREPTLYVYTIANVEGIKLASFGLGIDKAR